MTPEPLAQASKPKRSRKQLLALLAGAILLWGFGAYFRSLWEDEFHSLHHAQREGLFSLLESVRVDNHPPLSFLLEHLAISLFGTAEWALRLPSLLVGLAFLWVLSNSLKRLAPFQGSTWAIGFVLASSYFFVLFTEARMYGLLALATLGLMLGITRILEEDETRASRWWMGLSIAVGLHSHYYFIYELLISGAYLSLVAWLHPSKRKLFKRFLVPGLLGFLCFVPWGLYGFRQQLLGDLPPGRALGGLGALRDGYAHIFHWNASQGGRWAVLGLALPGTLFAAIAGLLGVRKLSSQLMGKGREARQALMLLVFGLGLPSMTWTISRFSERSSFGWRYLAGAAIAIIIIATLGLSGASTFKRCLRGLLLLTMGSITLINLTTGGQEDYRQLIQYVLAHALRTDAVLDTAPFDPDPLPGETTWAYYVQRFDESDNPDLPQLFQYEEISQAQRKPRVWMWFSDHYHPWVRRTRRKTHPIEQQWQMGPALTLCLFTKTPSP